MTDDAALLHRYARDRSEADFAEVVRRHMDFVYSSALRQVNGDRHLAQDVTQVVFTDLARKASVVAGYQVLAGWLFTSTRYAAAKAIRANRRRQARELEAIRMQENETHDTNAHQDWERIAPVLDQALADLGERDREAILMRYFEGRDYAAVGDRLALSANAARMRVDRALEKLRASLSRRGATSSVAALTLALTGHATVAAPVGLAATITTAALASGGVAATALTFMGLTKLQSGIAAGVVAVGAVVYIPQELAADALREEMASGPSVRAEIAQLREGNRQLARNLGQFERAQVRASEIDQLREQLVVSRKEAEEREAARVRAAAATRARTMSAPAPALSLADLDVRPRPKVMKAPPYPAKMAAAGLDGSVEVEFMINAEGNVVELNVLNSTHTGFEVAALQGIQAWTFEPGQKAGVPVNTRLVQRLEFKLNPDDPNVTPPDWF